MVAYSFNKMFIPAIQSGLKYQTIRPDRKRHARIGERIQLYHGMRTKKCVKIIDDPVVTDVCKVRMLVDTEMTIEVTSSKTGSVRRLSHQEARDFAIADGFGKGSSDPLRRMHGFWILTYGRGEFDGVLIRWEPPREIRI